MSALDQINAYMARLEARLRWLLWSRGLAVAAGAALAITVLLAVFLRLAGFIDSALTSGRTLLFLAVALAVAFGLAVPLLRLNRRWAARRAESQYPGFQQRLLTLVERQGQPGPLAELLAEDALAGARENEPEKLVPAGWIIGLSTAAGAAATALLWLVFAGPGFLGYGSALLWGNTPRTDLYPARTILVQPGNLTLRRKAGLQVTARLIGFSAPAVRLFARYRNTPKWDAIPMQAEPGGDRYQFLIAGVDDTLDYYVEAGSVHSKNYTLTVRDLPVMKALRVRYHFPPALGMPDAVEDPGGDLRAVEGTEAELSIETDRPLSNGAIVLDSGARIPLTAAGGNAFTARVPILKDGSYSVGAIDAGENVRLSDDYFIEARRDAPPSVKITFPGRDSGVNPIEELSVKVEAEDDYGLKGVNLHYSVNGGPEKSVSLLPRAATKKVDGKSTIYLEDFHLSPGDVVSYYAEARDAKTATKSDIYFASAQPFDLRFSQAQAAGGSGMGGDDDPQFSERQKEIIGATWNEIKNPKQETAAAEARFLSDMQAKLSDQAHSLAERIRARNIDNSSPEFKIFTEYMDKASQSMKTATEHLRPGRWNDAMPSEQKSLQALLRAEAAFRDIRVAFGSQNGGGGGGGTSARDLQRLLDLELDTQKNQYETEQAGTKSEEAKKLDEALQKLKDLARRQQELAAEQRKADQQFRQRWEQEMLRREAEDLRRQLEEAQQQQSQSRQGQRSQGQGSQQAGSQGSQSSSRSGSQSDSQSNSQNNSQSNSQPGAQQGGEPAQQANGSSGSSSRPGRMSTESSSQFESALRQIEQAEEQMRAGNSGDPDAARRASERLRDAQQAIEGARQQQAARRFGDLERKASDLARAHQSLADSMRQQFAGGGKQQQDDPRFGPAPSRSSPQARQLADQEERLASELKALRQEMGDLSKSLSGEQPDASSKLKQALGELDESDLEMRMRKSAEWMRKGEGMLSWMRESTTSMGLDKLREQIQQAGAALRKDGRNGAQPGGAKEAQSKRLESALGEVQQMRKQLEQLRAGNSPDARRVADEAKQGVGRIRQSTEGQSDIGVGTDLEGLSGSIQQLAGGDPRELKDRLEREVLPALDRLEIELRRRLDEQLAENVRTATPEKAPDGYADAVAEYFRRLSKK